MALPLIPIAIGLAAKFLPDLVGRLAGDGAENVAEGVLNIAKSVTGAPDFETAANKLLSGPVDGPLQLDFQKAGYGFQEAMARIDVERLAVVNETMRAEASSRDKYVRRWRPFWGYSTGVAFASLMFGLMIVGGWAVIKQPTMAAQIINALAGLVSAMFPLWGVALSVLGVSVWKRSDDKAIEAGAGPATGILGALATRIAGGQAPEGG